MRRTQRVESVFWLLVLAVLAPAFAGDRVTQRPSLQGKWKLNEDLTARLREDDRPPGGMGGFRGGMGRRPGEPGGGFPGGGRRGKGGFGERERRGPESFTALTELTIVQAEGQVTLTDQDGHARTLQTDGSKVREEQGPGGPAEVRASWEKDGTLVVRIKPDDGPKRTESFVVSNDGKHLYVTMVLEGGPREFRIRRAYDAVAEEQPPPEPGS